MSDQDRLLAAWYRIGGEVPARIVDIFNRICNVQSRLARCPDSHADEVSGLHEQLDDYRDYCRKQLSASVTDPATLEAQAKKLETDCTNMENELSDLEEYCRDEGH